MTRYARKLVTSAEDAWDAKINDNMANVFDRPLPLHDVADDLAAAETAFPSGTVDDSMAIVDYDGTPANGKVLAFNDGTQWNQASNWQLLHRLVPVAKSAAHTALDTEDYFVLTGASTYDFTLPAIGATNKGRRVLIKFNGTGIVTMKPTGGDTYDGAASFVVTGNANSAYEFISDGVSDWQILVHSAGVQIIPLIVAVGDEISAITTGLAKITFRVPAAFTVSEVRASLGVASSAGTVTVDINEGGTTILSTKLTIDATETTSTTAVTPAVVSDAALADDAEITIDIDDAGSSADAIGLKVTILGTM
jgi:hypothetical protein